MHNNWRSTEFSSLSELEKEKTLRAWMHGRRLIGRDKWQLMCLSKLSPKLENLILLPGGTEYLICCRTGPLPCQPVIWGVPVMVAQPAQELELQAQIFKTFYIPYLWTDTLWSAKPVILCSSLFSSFTKLLIKFHSRQVYRAMLYLGKFTKDYFLC